MAGADGGSFIDPRLLGRPSTFDGKEEQWSDWAFQAGAYLATLSPRAPDHIEAAEQQQMPIAPADLGTEAAETSRRRTPPKALPP